MAMDSTLCVEADKDTGTDADGPTDTVHGVAS